VAAMLVVRWHALNVEDARPRRRRQAGTSRPFAPRRRCGGRYRDRRLSLVVMGAVQTSISAPSEPVAGELGIGCSRRVRDALVVAWPELHTPVSTIQPIAVVKRSWADADGAHVGDCVLVDCTTAGRGLCARRHASTVRYGCPVPTAFGAATVERVRRALVRA